MIWNKQVELKALLLNQLSVKTGQTMKKAPSGILKKLNQRKTNNAFRKLPKTQNGIDFSSNDYLGFSQNEKIYEAASDLLKSKNTIVNGATGSRLITGNSPFFEEVEQQIAGFHQAESALLFNSGFDANIGFFSSVPQRSDVIFYDELAHASIREGIKMGLAKAYKFKHNNLKDLKQKVKKHEFRFNDVFIVTESVFSMDGDSPDLKELIKFCSTENRFLIVDEAHALGVFGEKGQGLVHAKNTEDEIFARIMTFGKGLGCHGAAVLGNRVLKDFLINFARSFIYTTALPPHTIATISVAYSKLPSTFERKKLQQNIIFFKSEMAKNGLQNVFIKSDSAIQSCVIPGNEKVNQIAEKLHQENFQVKAILSPTVPKGSERLRFCVHSFNTEEEISQVLQLLTTFACVNYRSSFP